MSKIRSLSTDEWFLQKQLKALQKRFHLPAYYDIDISRIHSHYKDQGKKTPYTALLIKSVGILLEEAPELNKMVFNTFYGKRLLEFDEITINMPMYMKLDGIGMLTAMNFKSPQKKTIDEIRAEIKKAAQRTWKDLPINSLIHRKNRFIARPILSLILWIMNNFPSLYAKKGGGGVSVSSLMNNNVDQGEFRVSSYGPTALTFCSCSVKNIDEKHIWHIGITLDHMSAHGAEVVKVIQKFGDILRCSKEEYFERLTT